MSDHLLQVVARNEPDGQDRCRYPFMSERASDCQRAQLKRCVCAGVAHGAGGSRLPGHCQDGIGQDCRVRLGAGRGGVGVRNREADGVKNEEASVH
jgi:hypothetical protein